MRGINDSGNLVAIVIFNYSLISIIVGFISFYCKNRLKIAQISFIVCADLMLVDMDNLFHYCKIPMNFNVKTTTAVLKAKSAPLDKVAVAASRTDFISSLFI